MSRSFLFWIVLVLSTLRANAGDSFVVDQLRITGLHRTDVWIIRRELQFAEGDTLTTELLNSARNRLLNLGLFNEVAVSADSSGTVLVSVSEAWPIIPLLSVSLTEGSLGDVLTNPAEFFDRATVYAGVGDLNFRGGGGLLFGFAQMGAEDGFSLSFHTRWLSRTLPIALRTDFQNLRVSDRHAAVLDTSAGMRDVRYSVDVATRAGAPSRIGLALQYRAVRKDWHPDESRARWRTFWYSPYAVIDRRDLEWYPTQGAVASVQCDAVIGDTKFVRSFFDLRGYLPAGRVPPQSRRRNTVLALRFAASTSSAETPSWAHFYHGFNTGFRGYEGVRSESAGYLQGSAELRFSITPETSYDVPLLGRYGKRWPWGILGVLFAERAELQLDGKRSERSGVGGGLHFRVPYVQIVELSFAVNRRGGVSYAASTGVRF